MLPLMMTALLLTGPSLLAQDEDLLSGPSVTDEAEQAPASIVQRSFDGTLERPEGLPEMAALDLLGLDEEERTKVDDALAERHGAIDVILADNLDVFQKTVNAFQSGMARRGNQSAEFRRTMREVRELVAPIAERGTLREEIGAALDDGPRHEFERMMKEWDDAVAQEEPEGRASARPERQRRGGERFAERRREFAALLREFGSSYQRVIGQRVEDYRALLDELDVDAQTKGVIEAATQGALSGEGDESERRGRLLREIMDELTPEQRRQLLSELRRVRPEGAGGMGRDR